MLIFRLAFLCRYRGIYLLDCVLSKIAHLNVAHNAPIFPLISFILIYVFNIIELKTIKSTTLFNSILIAYRKESIMADKNVLIQ